jgi:hypothetical protein
LSYSSINIIDGDHLKTNRSFIDGMEHIAMATVYTPIRSQIIEFTLKVLQWRAEPFLMWFSSCVMRVA